MCRISLWSRRFVYYVGIKRVTQNGVDDAFCLIFCTKKTLDIRRTSQISKYTTFSKLRMTFVDSSVKRSYVSIFCLRDFWFDALTCLSHRVRFWSCSTTSWWIPWTLKSILSFFFFIVSDQFRRTAPFLKTYHVGGNSCPERLVPFGFLSIRRIPFWRNGPRTCPVSFGFTIFSMSCFIPHFSPREHWPFVIHCMQSPRILLHLSLDLPSAAAASEAAFPNSRSR